MSNHKYPPLSEQMCGNCRYHKYLKCRRYAPRPAGITEEACWPVTDKSQWCGEWAPREASE
jgi:hypothetical protein